MSPEQYNLAQQNQSTVCLFGLALKVMRNNPLLLLKEPVCVGVCLI